MHTNVWIRTEVTSSIIPLSDTHFKEAIEIDLSKAGKCAMFLKYMFSYGGQRNTTHPFFDPEINHFHYVQH